MEIEIGSYYRHFKGGIYQVLHLALDTQTNNKVVVYKNIDTQCIYVRPVYEFIQEIDKGRQVVFNQKYRFEKINKMEI